MSYARTNLIAVAALLALFAGLAVHAARHDAVTSDEVAHLPAGYTYLKERDLRLNPQHPPLAKAVAALPLLALDLAPIESLPGWERADDRVFGAAFLTANRVPLERLLFLGRLPMILLFGLVLCVLLCAWARELWGPAASLWVVFVAALSPELLAHSHLVTTDAALAGCSVAVVYALWRFAEHDSLADAVWCGFALGCALLVKYSGLLTAAIAFALLPIAARGRPWKRQLAATVLIAGIAIVMVSAVYGLPFGLVEYAGNVSHMNRDFDFRQASYLWGEQSVDGFWYYYLLAQLWKTPLPALLLFGAALLGPELRRPATRRNWIFLLLPIVAFHAAGFFYRPNIGVRHVLPALPFLLLATGAPVSRALRSGGIRRAAPIVLGLWYCLGTLRVAPHFLAYFNELVGGPTRGIHYLSDSNLDWGQDVYALRDYLQDAPPATLRAVLFSPLDLAAQGIAAGPLKLRDIVWPEEGVTYAVSANFLLRTFQIGRAPLVFQWLQLYEPVKVIGGSIRVYRFSTNPADVDHDGVTYVPRAEWYGNAIHQLAEMNAIDPAMPEPRALLARIHQERSQWRAANGDPNGARQDAEAAMRLAR